MWKWRPFYAGSAAEHHGASARMGLAGRLPQIPVLENSCLLYFVPTPKLGSIIANLESIFSSWTRWSSVDPGKVKIMACMETGVQNQDPVCAAAGRMCEQITKRLQDPGAQQVTVVVPGSPPSYNTGGFMRAVQAADFNRALKQRRREAHEVKPKPLTTSQDVARRCEHTLTATGCIVYIHYNWEKL